MRLVADADVGVVIVDFISDEMKSTLRSNLASYCYGAVRIEEDSTFYSFGSTMLQFIQRFDSKARTVRLGMAGELLIHMLVGEIQFPIASAGIFFNKEERNIKKGFDLTFLEPGSSAVWYGEVKSGETEGTANDKVHALLTTAANDLVQKLRPGAPRSRWESALLDADLTLQSVEARTMKTLLRADATTFGNGSTPPLNAVLAGVVFHATDHCCIDEDQVRTSAAALVDAAKFRRIKVIAAQQTVFDELVAYIRTELATLA